MNNSEIIFLPSCIILQSKQTFVGNNYIKLQLTVQHPSLKEDLNITISESFLWAVTHADSFKAVFNQSIKDNINNLPNNISCLIEKRLTGINVLGIGKEDEKVLLNLSPIDYFNFQDLAFYSSLDHKIPNKDSSNTHKHKI